MNSTFYLDKESKIPFHQQLYCYIKDCIEQDFYQQGSSLPSENEMQILFNVSRITIRRALSDLEHDGYLRKQRGKGTIVCPRKNERTISTFNSFSGDAKVKGDKPGSIILQCKKVTASIKVVNRLMLDQGEDVYFLKRLRLLNGHIIALHETYVSTRIGVPISDKDFDSTTSLYEFLEEKGICLGSANETIEAKMVTTEIRRELFMEENRPVIYKERVTYDANGLPIEFSMNTYVADSYKYLIHIVNVREEVN